MLHEISQTTEKQILYDLTLHVESKKVKLVESESRIVVAKPMEIGRWGDVGQRVQTFSYKMNKLWRSNVQHGNYS